MRIRIRGKISAALLLASLACVAQLAAAQPDINDAPKGANPPAGRPAPNFNALPKIASNLIVIEPDGTPLKDATLMGTFKGKTGGSRTGFFTTNEDGCLTFQKWNLPLPGQPDQTLPTGLQAIYLSLPDVGSVVIENTEVKTADAAPVNLRLQSGGMLKIKAGEAAGARAVGGADIILTYLPNNEEPIENDNFRGYRGLSLFGNEWTRDGDGSKEVKNLYPRRYLVSVSAMGLEYSDWTQEITIEENQTLSLNADLERALTTFVQIHVEDQEGKPIVNTQIQLSLRLNSLQARSTNATSNLRRTLLTDAQGQCTLYPIKPGRWQLTSAFNRITDQGNIIIHPQEILIPATGGTAIIVAKAQNVQIINR